MSLSTPSRSRGARGSSALSGGVESPGRASIGTGTLRTDRWWLQPLATFSFLSAWVIYATVRVCVHSDYWVAKDHYLTPFYSPCLTKSCTPDSALFGRPFPHFPIIIPFAILTLIFLLGFRMTCYYYRKAYYRSFWGSPPACAVAEPHKKYTGETRFPLIIQNSHRYFFYAAGLISIINTIDLIESYRYGLGLGNIIMLINVLGLWAYTASCHSCRSLMGGRLNHFSKHPIRYRLWTQVTKLNGKHMQLALGTLVTLAVTDGYIALVAAGAFADPRIIS
ncbi:MAG TPA: hypothetical protein VHX59_17530 [Mycobacteriales bacterium]|jgi:hypothetical protein|nr:hypothetical protein [Mycobacteriales bacterium]